VNSAVVLTINNENSILMIMKSFQFSEAIPASQNEATGKVDNQQIHIRALAWVHTGPKAPKSDSHPSLLPMTFQVILSSYPVFLEMLNPAFKLELTQFNPHLIHFTNDETEMDSWLR
jgi:hypothetical protein